MHEIPLTILSKEEGIPIPNNLFRFSLSHEAAAKMETVEVELRPGIKEKFFAIGVSNDTSIAIELCASEEEKKDNLNPIGVICILKAEKVRDFDTLVKAKIVCRTHLRQLALKRESYWIPFEKIKEEILPGEEELVNDLSILINYIIANENIFSPTLKAKVKTTDDLIKIANVIVSDIPLDHEDRLEYLQYQSNLERITFVIRHLFVILASIRAGDNNRSTATIRRNMTPSEAASIIYAANAAHNNPSIEKETNSSVSAPKEVRSKIEKEKQRLKELPPSSLEYQTIKEYLAWLEGLPWGNFSYKEPDLKKFISILNKSHYGLDQVKECILEHMVIEKLSDNSRGSVICFLGPPGTGKTSIAKSIAEATNREIIKIALGGMSDEAELRGHRRTYVASRPGRIIAGLKNCGTFDPIVLLDEVDKMGNSRGDPTSALLEILDPEQNNEFIDRYIESPIDLSKVMFICTANYEEQIPPALKDRFEIIYFRDYDYEEKLVILEEFLIPEVKADFHLDSHPISFSSDTLARIASLGGIRDIKRGVQKLLRKAAVQIVVNEQTSVEITPEDVESLKKNKNKTKNIGFGGD